MSDKQNFFDYKLENTNLIINIFIKEAFMKKKEMKTKVMAVAMSTVMVASICPAIPAVAATSSTDIAKIQDGTYTGTAKCIPDEYEEFDPYDLTVKVTVANGTITSISDISGNGGIGRCSRTDQ